MVKKKQLKLTGRSNLRVYNFNKQEEYYAYKIVRVLTKNGKKTKALRMFRNMLVLLNYCRIKTHSPMKIIEIAINNVKPIVYLKKMRRSSKVFYLPMQIPVERQINLGIRFIAKSLEFRTEKKYAQRLANEIVDCFFHKGFSIRRKQRVYELLEASRPFLYLLKKK